MVEFRGVSKVYARAVGGRVHALAEATFRVSPGELVILSGPSGAGKSTVLRLAAGEESPTAGTVLVDDQDLGALSRRGLARLRRSLGVILQEPRLVADRTVFGNVALVLRALGLPGSEVRTRALGALRDVGLGTKPNALPAELAAGERQRLALARALAPGPRLVLADEPFAGLDAADAGEWLALLRAVQAQGGTVLVATRATGPPGGAGARVIRLQGGHPWPDGGPSASA